MAPLAAVSSHFAGTTRLAVNHQGLFAATTSSFNLLPGKALADATTAVDGAEVLVHEAAWARSEGRSVAKLGPMAKLFACRTFRDVTATAQQIFGGIGFTVEFDIQLYFRRAKQLQISWWDTRYLEELVAAAVLDD